jgi:ABC-type dipeptide/oligopeptide/nickel transport system ATPase component
MFDRVREIMADNKIISIIGESSTGKTTLALQLVTTLMTLNENINKQTIWVQASEKFPKRRLITMYQEHQEVISILLQNIFIFPKINPFSNISSQSKFLKNFHSLILPPETRYIVIDNISHHLRFAQANISDLRIRMKFMNEFFNQELFPLIMLCLRENYYLFLIHEVSFDPQSGQLRAYNNYLFERVKGVEIYLSKSMGSNLKSMNISIDGVKKQYTYEISDQGVLIL